jgi:signal transduction histidine kinase/ligand-binding sensor domain-containing protein
MKKLFTCLCITCVALQLHTQNPFARYKVEHYDSKNGMPNDFVMNTYQAKDGFIWMNSYSGYIRFDGKQFVTFSASNTPVIRSDNSNSLFTESEDSTLWFPTQSSGLIAYKQGRFTAYLLDHPSLFLMGKSKNQELILGTGGLDSAARLIVFNPKTRNYFTINRNEYLQYRHEPVNVNDAASAEWHVTNNQAYRKENNGSRKLLGIAEGLSPELFVSSIFKDSKQRTWLTSYNGIYLWDGKQFKPFPGMETVNIPVPNPSFAYVAEDAEHGIWVSVGNGVAYLPDGSERFYTFPRKNMNIQTLHNITIDREQNIWLATDRGVYKLSKTKVINYAEAEGITNNRVSSITEVRPGEFLLTSALESLYWLKDGYIQRYSAINSNAFQKNVTNFIYSKTDSKGNVWLGHQAGVLKISPDGEINYPLNNQVRYVVEGLDGRMYFAVSYTGIAYINEKSEVKFLNLPKVDFSSAYISSMLQLKDSSWLVNTFRTGAMIIDKNGDPHELDLFNGTKGVQVFNAKEEKDGAIWFATGTGLVKWYKGKAQTIGIEAGLNEPGLFGILPDQLGNWWFPTNKGVFYAKYTELEAYLKNKNNKIDWKLIDDGDGMNNRQCVGARHSIVAKDGKLLVLGIGGLVEIDPTTLQTNLTPPLLSINSLNVDDSLYYAGTSAVISPGDHRYIFDYSALSFVAPGKNQIRFRLIGQDKDWITSKGDNRAFYTNLAPGDYSFEITASNNDGVWSESPAVFSFTVKPFFYQTLWFKILAAILILGIIWLLILWRTRAARAKNIWLENQVAQRTAELKNSLDQLQSTQKQLVQSEKMASLGELTAGIAHEIQNPLNFVTNFSEVNKELADELQSELATGNIQSANNIAADIKDNSEKINHHSKRADAIVKGMLQHSRTSSGVKELTDINALCDEYLRLAYHGLRAKDKLFNVPIKTDFDESTGNINIVRQDIGRVVLNLINNAFYAVDEKKKQISDSYEPTVIVSTKKQNGKVEISVKDNGIGIPQKVLDKIFQPFFTTKPTGQGTGLGLSLSYDIVKAHSGELKVETKEGAGSEFIISLPVN